MKFAISLPFSIKRVRNHGFFRESAKEIWFQLSAKQFFLAGSEEMRGNVIWVAEVGSWRGGILFGGIIWGVHTTLNEIEDNSGEKYQFQ